MDRDCVILCKDCHVNFASEIKTQTSIDTSQNAQQKLKEFKELKHHSSQSLKDRIVWLDAPLEIRSCIYHKYKELMSYGFDNSEYPKLNTWLQYALKIPYNILKPISASSDMSQFLTRTYDRLNEEFYGLRNVKEQILLYLSTKLNNPAAKNFSLALVGSKGVGKCFAKDTPILMHDGKVKKVQNVVKGDRLMGLDGEPRIVLQLMKGYDTMYEVRQKVGMTYTVCRGHILILRCIQRFLCCSNSCPNTNWLQRVCQTMLYIFQSRLFTHGQSNSTMFCGYPYSY